MYDVRDEPLYAAYLALSGKTHPMQEEILAAQPSDWKEVIADCTGSDLPDGMFQYQKHMSHHMLVEIPRDWVYDLNNVFLIRNPRRVVASYANRFETVSLDDLGFRQQAELFDRIAVHTGTRPPVVDAEEIRANPEDVLGRLCEAIGIPFEARMLSWAPGPRPGDGAWAPHWYASLHKSTGFAPPDQEPGPMSTEMEVLADTAKPYYDHMHKHRI